VLLASTNKMVVEIKCSSEEKSICGTKKVPIGAIIPIDCPPIGIMELYMDPIGSHFSL
jgi:hypothetical protein